MSEQEPTPFDEKVAYALVDLMAMDAELRGHTDIKLADFFVDKEGTLDWSVCRICSAVVQDRDRHIEWHGEQRSQHTWGGF